MPESLSNRQIVTLLFVAVTATYSIIDLPKSIAQNGGRSGWLFLVGGALLAALAVLIISDLNRMFCGKILFDYTEIIICKVAAYILTAYYVVYFIIIEAHLNIKLTGVLSSNFLPKTSVYIFLIITISLSAYIASKGIRNVGRVIEITGILYIIITILVCTTMILGGDKYNILPLFNKNDFSKISSSARELILPFGGIEILLCIPFVKQNKKIRKKLFITMLCVGLFYILIVESTIKILGINNTVFLNDSFLEAIKTAPSPVIERLDIVYLTFGLCSVFSGFGVIFTVAVEHAYKLFPKSNRKILIVVMAIIIFALSFVCTKFKDIGVYINNSLVYFVIIASVVIPFVLWLIARIKKSRNFGVKSI